MVDVVTAFAVLAQNFGMEFDFKEDRGLAPFSKMSGRFGLLGASASHGSNIGIASVMQLRSVSTFLLMA